MFQTGSAIWKKRKIYLLNPGEMIHVPAVAVKSISNAVLYSDPGAPYYEAAKKNSVYRLSIEIIVPINSYF